MIHETATIHEHALVEPGAEIGPRTRVWAFAHVLPGACIGADCNICDYVFIEGDVTVGDRVTVKSGVQLWDGLKEKGSDPFTAFTAFFTALDLPRHPLGRSMLRVFRRDGTSTAQPSHSRARRIGLMPNRV